MKVRKQGSWKEWKSSSDRHNLEILVINVVVILGVFVVAAIIQ
ncbi:hypothetical protein [Chryseobacterium geocarposphaerae]|uniref:Uncharacterized protein n=1 Tax=Chryseobacterium geocarposphaerae TaxID=1416776 RepID=A0A2M9C735_9FLAO|nr:hypothetical protein [Chryseobacterium geocarposphaerae]PJJ66647.1 hypothetical protein CLV73_0637 [Chryseobacterium geocarposphaerae]